MSNRIPFNIPFITGKELQYIRKAIDTGRIEGNGIFTQKCQRLFQKKYGYQKVFLTHSCTGSLEMAAILANIKKGDEVIVPSFTFVTSASAFVLRGAKIVFADSNPMNPNIDAERIEALITDKTKAIVVLHYAGIACDMEKISALAKRYRLFVIEDAAHSINARYKNKPLGSLGTFGCFSFHESKNITAGEGGMLVVNDRRFFNRAETVWEKGTNRAAFFRGEISKYEWVDIGSSFLPSEITTAFLLAQSEQIDNIQKKRMNIRNTYFKQLTPLEEQGYVHLPFIPDYASDNGHLFYLVTENKTVRNKLITFLNNRRINAVFHYLPLHLSPFYKKQHDGRVLKYAEMYSNHLVRLPLYCNLSRENLEYVISVVTRFFKD